MFTLPLCLAAPILAGAAAVAQPIEGAFGLTFGSPVAEGALGATIAEPPHREPPANLPQALPELTPTTPLPWRYFEPSALPEPLRHPGARFRVLLTRQRHPARIVAESPAADCPRDFPWLVESLSRKYLTDDDPTVAPRPGFDLGARFAHGASQVDVACGRRLLVEYTNREAYTAWLAEAEAGRAAYEAEQFKLRRLAQQIQRQRDKHFADAFTVGDRFRLDGAFGLVFGEPVKQFAEHPVDEPFPAQLDALPEPFAGATCHLTLAPDGSPIRLEAKLEDPDGALFERLRAALRAKYGNPLKDRPRHVIHRVNGNYAVLRRLERLGEVDIVFIDNRAQKAQEARLEAAAQRQFEEATEGL